MATVINLKDVSVRRGNATLIEQINWQVDDTERWVVIGPNGAGKSTLIAVVSANLFPTSGQVEILDEKLGAVDVFELRPRIGLSSALLAGRVPDSELVKDVVVSSAYAVVGRWREHYDQIDYDRAEYLMANMKVAQLANRSFGSLSDGEKKRVLVARALMADPEILLMDEPAAGLDLAGREILVAALKNICLDQYAPASILITHHVEDIPEGITHALLLKDGKISAAGPIDTTLTSENMSECFDMPLVVQRNNGRWSAFALNQ